MKLHRIIPRPLQKEVEVPKEWIEVMVKKNELQMAQYRRYLSKLHLQFHEVEMLVEIQHLLLDQNQREILHNHSVME